MACDVEKWDGRLKVYETKERIWPMGRMILLRCYFHRLHIIMFAPANEAGRTGESDYFALESRRKLVVHV